MSSIIKPDRQILTRRRFVAGASAAAVLRPRNAAARRSRSFFSRTGFPPSIARARGYNRLFFVDDFNSLSTIDVNQTFGPNFNWYTNGFSNIGGNADRVPDPSWYVINESILSLTSNNGGFQLNTYGFPQPAGTPGIVGLQSAGLDGSVGFYAEARIQFATGSSGYGAFWMYDVNRMEQIYTQTTQTGNVAEIDIMENTGAMSQTIHNWTSSGQDTYTTPHSIPWSSINLNNYHTFGVLIVPMSMNGGTGFCQFYMHRVAQGSPVTWTAGSTYSSVENSHFGIMCSTDANKIMNVDYIAVATPAAGGNVRKTF